MFNNKTKNAFDICEIVDFINPWAIQLFNPDLNSFPNPGSNKSKKINKFFDPITTATVCCNSMFS